MFKATMFPRAALLLLTLMVALVGCQSQSNPDSEAAATAKTREVIVEITGMS